MMTTNQRRHIGIWQFSAFVLIQIAVMLVAISNQSLWVDEFWTEYFSRVDSFKSFYDLLLVPSGSQTPLHFLHFYLWGRLNLEGEFLFRLANLPLFVAGQLAVFWALRDYPRNFAYLFLTLSALHPMIWQYANEARPYILMHAGSQMILAYLLNLHASVVSGRSAEPLFLVLFVVGSILLFGASLLGVFWVFSACVYVLIHHLRQSTWRELLGGVNPLLLGFFLVAIGLLSAYYLNSLLLGAGGSRLASSTPLTVLSTIYELLGLAGIGPSRLELRSFGASALAPYVIGLLVAASSLLAVLAVGFKEANDRLGTRELSLLCALGLLPVCIVIFSGFAMGWRVLGRHLFATLPLLNLVFALGLASLLKTHVHRAKRFRYFLAFFALSLLAYSSLSLRFSPDHRKDDYRAAAAIAKQSLTLGQKVWWAAGVIGASYYELPGEFDVLGELTSQNKPLACRDLPGVQSIANASTKCLFGHALPDVVILSKPDVFDQSGDIVAYLKAQQFVVVQTLPAFTIWRRLSPA